MGSLDSASTRADTAQVRIERTSDGWNILEEFHWGTVHVAHYDDWHRVERLVRILAIDAMHHETCGTRAAARRQG